MKIVKISRFTTNVKPKFLLSCCSKLTPIKVSDSWFAKLSIRRALAHSWLALHSGFYWVWYKSWLACIYKPVSTKWLLNLISYLECICFPEKNQAFLIWSFVKKNIKVKLPQEKKDYHHQKILPIWFLFIYFWKLWFFSFVITIWLTIEQKIF